MHCLQLGLVSREATAGMTLGQVLGQQGARLVGHPIWMHIADGLCWCATVLGYDLHTSLHG